jgi:hypothetical protein
MVFFDVDLNTKELKSGGTQQLRLFARTDDLPQKAESFKVCRSLYTFIMYYISYIHVHIWRIVS